MRRRPPVTQAALARHLGIDQSTVSRAFTEPAMVAEDLRKRITDAALRLGYRTNRMARATRLGRTENLLILQGIGVSVSTLHAEILAGLHDAVAGTGLHLSILRLEDRVLTDEAQLPAVLRDLSADGLLLNYEIHTPPALSTIITRHRMPALWMNVEREFDTVRPDDAQATAMLVDHLRELGHQRIAYIDLLRHLDENPHVSRADRMHGYEQAMAEAGQRAMVIAPTVAPRGLSPVEVVRSGLAAMTPTAVITYGGHDAATAAIAAGLLGWAVPERLSIATVSEFPLLSGWQFTTAVNPFRALGMRAVALLRQQIDQPQLRVAIERLPFTLVPGQTTGRVSR